MLIINSCWVFSWTKVVAHITNTEDIVTMPGRMKDKDRSAIKERFLVSSGFYIFSQSGFSVILMDENLFDFNYEVRFLINHQKSLSLKNLKHCI